jgi:hypothetical protein
VEPSQSKELTCLYRRIRGFIPTLPKKSAYGRQHGRGPLVACQSATEGGVRGAVFRERVSSPRKEESCATSIGPGCPRGDRARRPRPRPRLRSSIPTRSAGNRRSMAPAQLTSAHIDRGVSGRSAQIACQVPPSQHSLQAGQSQAEDRLPSDSGQSQRGGSDSGRAGHGCSGNARSQFGHFAAAEIMRPTICKLRTSKIVKNGHAEAVRDARRNRHSMAPMQRALISTDAWDGTVRHIRRVQHRAHSTRDAQRVLRIGQIQLPHLRISFP